MATSNIADKVVAITGASSGIGDASVKKSAQRTKIFEDTFHLKCARAVSQNIAGR